MARPVWSVLRQAPELVDDLALVDMEALRIPMRRDKPAHALSQILKSGAIDHVRYIVREAVETTTPRGRAALGEFLTEVI